MDDGQHREKDTLVQSLWNAIFRGTKLRYVGAGKDPRIFVLKSINWARQESRVIDVESGEVFRFPWTELEFLDPVDGNIPGMPPVPKI